MRFHKLQCFQILIRPSTTHRLQRTYSEIIVSGYENKKFTAAAFLDVSQAFDNVWCLGLDTKIKTLNPPIRLYNISLPFITNHYFHVGTGTDISQVQIIKAGVPRGPLLGPASCNVYRRHNTANWQCSQTTQL